MGLRGGEHREAIQAVVRAFGADARDFVFIGGCVLGVYARELGAPLRMTKDVDCISTAVPWSRQEAVLSRLCQSGVLSPDGKLACRYRIEGTEVEVDVLSPEGFNVGGVNPWFKRAATRAQTVALEGGLEIRVVTPPYFLATKLVAFGDRGPDPQSSKDAEDIVALSIEVDGLHRQVAEEGLSDEIAVAFRASLAKYGLGVRDVPDLVDWHLHPLDRAERDRAVDVLERLASGR